MAPVDSACLVIILHYITLSVHRPVQVGRLTLSVSDVALVSTRLVLEVYSLYLLHISLAQHLRVLDQLVAYLSALTPIEESILMLAKLGLESTDLKIHLALVSRLVHLLSQQELF